MVSRLVLFLGALLATGSQAARLPFTARASPPSRGVSFTAWTNSSTSDAVGFEALSNGDNLLYLVDAELGGSTFRFHIDTGSADLWVLTNNTGKTVSITNTTDIAAAVVYADKSGLLGPVNFAELKLGGFTVNSQAFINPNKTLLPEQLAVGGRNGIIGLGFDSLSTINTVLQTAFGNDTTLGRTPLSNIFQQDPDLPNNLDLFLQRSDDLETSNNGTFLIGEHAEGFEDIVNRPKLFTSVDARWTVPMDGISVNGKPLTLPKSTLPTLRSATSSQLGANLDTGSSNVFVTADIMNAIYSAIPGAIQLEPTEPTSTWIVPCLNAANVTFTFGGQIIPIHPLDLTRLTHLEVPVDNRLVNCTLCSATYVGGAEDTCAGGICDTLLGDAFLRNVYQRYVYGNETDGAKLNNGSYIQLMPATDPLSAWESFTVSRTATLRSLPPDLFEIPGLLEQLISESGAQTETETAPTAEAAGALSDNGSDSDGSNAQLLSLVQKYGPVVIGLLAGNVVIGLLLFVVAIASVLRRSSTKTRTINSSYTPVRFKEVEPTEERYHDHDG